MELVRSTTSELAGGIYSYLDNDDRLVLVNANGFLQRISHTQAAGGSWSLNVESSVQIGYPDVVGLVPDYQGRVWFATAQGTSAGSGSVVGYYDPSTEQTAHFTLPAGEQVANSISSSPAGVAVASTAALYMFNAGTNAPEQLWRETYDAGPARKPGQLSWGTGATPAFFGPTNGYEYLTITDNAAPQENILVYQTISGALVGSVPFLTAGVNSGNEDAAIAVGNSIYYPSTFGGERSERPRIRTVRRRHATRGCVARRQPSNRLVEQHDHLGCGAALVGFRQPHLHHECRHQHPRLQHDHD